MAGLFDRIKSDVKKGIEEGIAAVKEGASVVSEKMGELTSEGKRQYKMFELKTKIQRQMTLLGGRVYDVLDNKKSPAEDSRVRTVYGKIKKLEDQLRNLEGGKATTATARKKPAKKATALRPSRRTSSNQTGRRQAGKAGRG